jgi:hypothetical protein
MYAELREKEPRGHPPLYLLLDEVPIALRYARERIDDAIRGGVKSGATDASQRRSHFGRRRYLSRRRTPRGCGCLPLSNLKTIMHW